MILNFQHLLAMNFSPILIRQNSKNVLGLGINHFARRWINKFTVQADGEPEWFLKWISLV